MVLRAIHGALRLSEDHPGWVQRSANRRIDGDAVLKQTGNMKRTVSSAAKLKFSGEEIV